MGTREMPQEILKEPCGGIKEVKLIGLKLHDKRERRVITYSKVSVFI